MQIHWISIVKAVIMIFVGWFSLYFLAVSVFVFTVSNMVYHVCGQQQFKTCDPIYEHYILKPFLILSGVRMHNNKVQVISKIKIDYNRRASKLTIVSLLHWCY